MTSHEESTYRGGTAAPTGKTAKVLSEGSGVVVSPPLHPGLLPGIEAFKIGRAY